MQGYNVPWSDFHELNFDWLMKKFKFLSSKIEKIPTKVSQLINDLGFINALQASAAAPVQSVNAKTGNVVLDAADVGALPDTFREMYWCTYGTTTNAEIEQAIADGLLICCEYNDQYYLLTHRDSATKHIFNIIENTSTDPHSYWLTCDTDTWSNSSMLLAKNASPALTGTPTAPTAAAGDSSAQIATTAFVQGELDDYAPLASPALTGTPTAPTAAAGDSGTQIATTAFVQGEISGFVDAAGAAAAAPVQSVDGQTGTVITKYITFCDIIETTMASGIRQVGQFTANRTIDYEKDFISAYVWGEQVVMIQPWSGTELRAVGYNPFTSAQTDVRVRIICWSETPITFTGTALV